MSWLKAKDDELLRAEAVAGIPDRVSAQIAEVEVCVCLFSFAKLDKKLLLVLIKLQYFIDVS